MKTHIIRLEKHDDATSIRDKMSWSSAPRILLAFPKRKFPALRMLDLNLIQREAGRLGGQLGLVTRDAEIAANAHDLGIPVFSAIPDAQRLAWNNPRQEKDLHHQESRLDDLKVRRKEFQPKVEYIGPPWLRIACFALGMAGVFALVLLFLPTATISVDVQRLEQSLNLTFWASPEIASVTVNGGIPAHIQRITVEGNLEGKASGTISVAQTTARGNLILTNLTETEVIVPAGTKFLSDANPTVKFASINSVTVPAGPGNTTEASIQALVPGVEGNVGAETIQAVEGSIGLFISVINFQPTTGGSDHNVRSVSEQDYNRLYDTLLTSLSEEAMQRLTISTGEEQILIPSSLKIDNILKDKRTPLVGEPADTIHLNLSLELSALAVQRKDLEQAARMALDAGIPHGYISSANGIDLKNETTPIKDAKGNIRWIMQAVRTIEPIWDIDQTTKMLAGQPLSKASSILAQQVKITNKPTVSIFPSFWNRFPYLPFRIHLIIK